MREPGRQVPQTAGPPTPPAPDVFSPTTSTTLSGTQHFASVNIPAGLTVTATGDLDLSVSGALTIAGTLTGNCVA